MEVLWQRVGTPSTGSSRAGKDTVGGAVACVVGQRVYLVGGSGASTSDPDIALACFSWSSSPHSSGEAQQQSCNSACNSNDAAAVDDAVAAAAPSATISRKLPTSSVPRSAFGRVSASQEGDVPAARIGHAAVTLPSSSQRPTASSRPTSIFVFGGEASNPSTAHENGSGRPVCRKFADVYEATPKAASGTLVWRALTPARVPTPRDPTAIDAEPHVSLDYPAPVAFHASCAACVSGTSGGGSSGTERALLIHGGINQSSELLGDLWAFFPARLSHAASNGRGGAGEGGDAGRSVNTNSNGDRTTGWERLQPQGEGPPPTAYHTATPVCGGNTVVFLGGGKNWGSSAVIFLLDAVGLKWSSFETAGGINLSGQRYLHTAIAMTGQDIDNNSGDTQVQQGDPTTSPSSQAAAAPGDAASPLAESESIDAAAAGEAQVPAPDVILWNPVGPARRGSVPVSARSGSSEKGAAAAAKKKPGAREGATAAKKAGSKEAAKGSGDSGGVDHPGDYNIDGAVPDVDDSGPPVFERILIFGGIVNEAAVIGEAVVLRHDGTVVPLHLGRKSGPPPGPRYSHTMVSVPAEDKGDGNGIPQLAFLFGGCRGDGTRATAEEAFVLDLASGGAPGGGGDDDDERTDEEGVDCEGAQAEPIVYKNGDVYTGERNCDGRRQGKGRCDYGAAGETAGGAHTAAGRSGGSGGYYSGDWDADEPHGRGERIYAAPGGTQARTGGRREGQVAGRDEDEDKDIAIAIAAFGPGCPPMASYRGDFKRGAREGNGVCTFFPPCAAGSGDISASGVGSGGLGATNGPSATASSALFIPESYDGEWVGGRPLGKGVLSLSAAPAAASGSGCLSSVKRSGSTMILGRAGQNGGGGGGGNCGGSLIEGMWTEEGLVHGREKLPGKGGVYEGQYRLGRREGHGRLDLPDGSEYEGAWKNGRQNGIGTFRCGVTRHVYTGKWVGGVRCGRGVCEYASGSRYDGLWLDGVRHGEGVLSSPPGGGASLAGLWHRDEFNLVSAAGTFRLSTESNSLQNALN